MRWQTPSERTMLVLLSPVLVPITVAAFAAAVPLFPIFWLWSKWNKIMWAKGWHSWFAWHPAHMTSQYCDDPQWAWLETVERRLYSEWEYRPVQKETEA